MIVEGGVEVSRSWQRSGNTAVGESVLLIYLSSQVDHDNFWAPYA